MLNDIKQGHITNIYDWYDGPLSYQLEGISGQNYYATYIDDCETIQTTCRVFLLVPSTAEKIKALVTGNTDIREFLLHESINGVVVIGSHSIQYTQTELRERYADDDWLPDVGVRYEES